jgi:hypothetical protein
MARWDDVSNVFENVGTYWMKSKLLQTSFFVSMSIFRLPRLGAYETGQTFFGFMTTQTVRVLYDELGQGRPVGFFSRN